MAIEFPKVPTMVDEHQSYTTDGKPNDVQAISLGTVTQTSNQTMPNFSSLIGTNVSVPISVDGNTMTFSDGSKMQLPESVVTKLNGRQRRSYGK